MRGTVRLPSGDVNLVATQLALDRQHANLITFQAEQGLDPLVDLVMSGGDLRVAIQVRGGAGSCGRGWGAVKAVPGGSVGWLHSPAGGGQAGYGRASWSRRHAVAGPRRK